MVFIGFVAIIFDMGRVSVTQGELQAYADNVALAAAGELDGAPDAITRATAAAANFVTDRQSFGNGSTALTSADYTITFLNALPANDTANPAPNATTDPAEAYYAWVQVTPKNVAMNFVSALEALTNTGNGPAVANVGAEAIAGFTVEACDITPLMFCLPSPTYTAEANIGDMIQLRSGGNGSAWGPGDFGFLDPTKADLGSTCAGLNGANLIGCLVGAELNVTQCFTQRGVDTEPGQKVGIEDAVFNVRFDIYKSTMNGEKNDPAYPPAPNVLSGLVPKGGGSCIGANEEVSLDTKPLPRDNCFYSAGGCTNRVGDGDWDGTRLEEYMAWNHDMTGISSRSTLQSNWSMHYSSVPTEYHNTRYGLYLAELARAGSNNITAPGRSESGLPQCNTNPAKTGARRRVVIAAGIDCDANPINGAEVGVPVAEFFEVFLTEPVGDDGASPPTLDLWVEVIGSAGGNGYGAAGTGGIFRDVVQLYR